MSLLHVSAVAFVLALAVGAGSAPAPPIFPEEASGRRLAERATFGRSDLFEYIDGGAEMYLAYGFERVWVASYRSPGEPEIAAEAYDMGSGEDAFGVLSVDPTGEHVSVGSVARYGAGLVRFCKGRWFVRVLAERETPETREAVLGLGAQMAGAIGEDSPLPDLLRVLPTDGLQPDSTTYFHTQITLNQLYYLSDENLLGLGAETEAVIADYKVGSGEAKLVIVRYPSKRRCLEAREAFLRGYLEVEDFSRPHDMLIKEIEDGRLVGEETLPPHLVLVLEAFDVDAARTLLAASWRQIRGGAEDE